MPSKNSIKQYIHDGYYHLYNRGVEKRPIFLDDQDYRVFLKLFGLYLCESDPDEINFRPHKDLSGSLELVAYCLMPNHFHLLVIQHDEKGITDLMRCLTTKYAMYFNRRYKRVGGLFQGVYKAALVQQDEYLMHLSRYIHRNPDQYNSPELYPYSSYQHYLSDPPEWLNPRPILELFADKSSYQDFVEFVDDDSLSAIDQLLLDN